MAQANINIRTDAAVKRDFERLCQDIGLNVTAALNVFMKQSIRENRLPVDLRGDPAYDEVTTTVPSPVITRDELARRSQELDAGFGIEVSIEELEALEQEGPDGPTRRAIEQRRQEMRARRREWEAQKNG